MYVRAHGANVGVGAFCHNGVNGERRKSVYPERSEGIRKAKDEVGRMK
jgi:hypothetical protein